MNVNLAYGKTGINVDFPDNLNIDVIAPVYQSRLKDEIGEISNTLKFPIGAEPLRALITPGEKIGIVFSDITRATPYHKILPPLLLELSEVPDEDIVFFIATGTHRANTREELISILGDAFVDRFRIVQNNYLDVDSHVFIGTTKQNNDIWIHKEFANCGLKILTGFIEPHFFAGFSGGGKAAMPGMALLKTIKLNHGPSKMDHKFAKWGITHGNPIWEEVHEAAAMLDNTFLLNITLNKDHEITGVFAGDVFEAHLEGCKFVKENAMIKVEELYDIVIASNSGYPLDLNLYQTVKGMSAAAQIIRPGGHIIMAAECWDGIPDHGDFGKILNSANTLDELLQIARNPQVQYQDLWQCHILALICRKAHVYLHTENINDDKLKNSFIIPCHDIAALVEELAKAYENSPRICMLPEGPQTIPYC